MTPEQIEELFIAAAKTDRKIPDTARPKALKAMSLEYVHTRADMNGWSEEDKYAANWAWLDPENLRNSKNDIGLWELCNELIKLVTSVRRRRCLWAWSMAEAGTLRAPKVIDGEMVMKRASFSRWCRDVEHIHRNWGAECRNRAIEEISLTFSRNALSDMQKSGICTLHEEPETGDKTSNIADRREFIWMAEDAFTARENPEAQDFSWAIRRNELRRQREEHARKRQAA